MLDKLPEEVLYFTIASGGGMLRYLSNLLAKKIVYNTCEFIVRIISSGLLGILAGWLAPKITSELNLQHAIIYVSGMLSIEIIKVIAYKVPDIISKKIDKGI